MARTGKTPSVDQQNAAQERSPERAYTAIAMMIAVDPPEPTLGAASWMWHAN